MKRLIMILIIIALFLLATASANYQATYDLVGGSAVVELNIDLPSKVSSFEWQLPPDTRAVEVKGLNFELTESKLLKITDGFFNQANIKYITSSVVEQSKDIFFILDLSGIEGDKSVIVKLPEGAALKYRIDSPTSAVLPKPTSVTSDGTRIILEWKNPVQDSIFVMYRTNQPSYWLIVPFIIVLVFLVVFGMRYTKKPSKNYTENLFEDEKKIVELLVGEKEGLWQKQLELKSGLSKVKLSRKIRSLEQKGVIEKVPYGNANRIRLKQS